jgi:hypothetical protein
VLLVLQAVMAAELVLLVIGARWMHVFLVAAVMIGMLVPELMRKKLPAEIPSELQMIAVLFVFASLFLGEVHDYYERIWWWDLALHGSAGLLLGLLGFLIVYVLNKSDVQVHLRPSFIALFAFAFAVAIGTLWELFEFAMDQSFGLVMQKPVEGDPSGLSDTMWDMIVNALTATATSVAGWLYVRHSRRRHIDTWMAKFMRRSQNRNRRRAIDAGALRAGR